MTNTKNAEALFQTPDQQMADIATYRIFLDGAWRNVEAPAPWKKLTQQELIAKLEAVYFTPR